MHLTLEIYTYSVKKISLKKELPNTYSFIYLPTSQVSQDGIFKNYLNLRLGVELCLQGKNE